MVIASMRLAMSASRGAPPVLPSKALRPSLEISSGHQTYASLSHLAGHLEHPQAKSPGLNGVVGTPPITQRPPISVRFRGARRDLALVDVEDAPQHDAVDSCGLSVLSKRGLKSRRGYGPRIHKLLPPSQPSRDP